MKSKLFAIFTLSVFILNLAGSSLADTKKKAPVVPAIVSLLPNSDGVAVVDVKRFLNVSLPQILSGNQKILGELNTALDTAKTKTGIDFRQFDAVAAGFTIKQIKEKEYDFDPVLIARGNVSAGGIVGAAKIAANGKYKEEKVGDRTIYIFSGKEIAAQQAPQGGKHSGTIQKAVGGFAEELAVTVLDPQTLAVGSLVRVKEALAGTTHLSPEINEMLGRTGTPVAAFASRVPTGLSSYLPLENDELGKNIESIQYMFGSMDVTPTATTLNATIGTAQATQASELKDTLDGLQMLGKAFLGGAKGDDKQVYARLIENVKFASKGNEVSMDLSIAQSDINFLVGLLKSKDAK